MKWTLEITGEAKRGLKRLEKKRSDEWDAVMRNLQIYHESLENAPHPAAVQHGFLHNEPQGIKAIDQSGPRKVAKLKQTRLYTYADNESKTLHILCVGDKNNQPGDIEKAKKLVVEIRKPKDGL